MTTLSWGSIFTGFPPMSWSDLLELPFGDLRRYEAAVSDGQKQELKMWKELLRALARMTRRRG